jgi:membrane dipeptidase
MLLIDAHLDLAWNATGWNRDLSLEISAMRKAEEGMTGKARGRNTVSLPEMRKASVGIAIVTVLARANAAGKSSLDFRNQDIASATALGQLAYYKLLERRNDQGPAGPGARLCRVAELAREREVWLHP